MEALTNDRWGFPSNCFVCEATIAVAGRWAVTAETTTRFTHPVRVGHRYTVTARVTSTITDDMAEVTASATITDIKDRPCAEASATFVVLGEAHAVDATGGAVGDDDRSFLRPASGDPTETDQTHQTDQTEGGETETGQTEGDRR